MSKRTLDSLKVWVCIGAMLVLFCIAGALSGCSGTAQGAGMFIQGIGHDITAAATGTKRAPDTYDVPQWSP